MRFFEASSAPLTLALLVATWIPAWRKWRALGVFWPVRADSVSSYTCFSRDTGGECCRFTLRLWG